MRNLVLALTAALLLPLAACNKAPEAVAPAELAVDDAVIRLPAADGRPAAAYFVLHGGVRADRLVSVGSAKVATIELHESRMVGGMMSMQPLTGVDLAPGATVEFKPGGNHAMLFGIDPVVKPGDSVPLTFTFQSGKSLAVAAKAQAAGDAMEMDHMEHETH